jgi:hypothetical protein
MPVYKISRTDRAKILNVTEDTHTKAQALIDAQRAKYPPVIDPKTGEQFIDPKHYLSWHDAIRMVEPKTERHPKIPTNIVDNGHHDHGTHHTMTFSRHMAKLLKDELGVEAVFVHDLNHV